MFLMTCRVNKLVHDITVILNHYFVFNVIVCLLSDSSAEKVAYL